MSVILNMVFLFLLLAPSSLAITSKAIIEIQNSPPAIELISANLNGNDLIIKIKIMDSNGCQDIQDAEVKIVYLENNDEQIYPRFGDNYKKAALDSAQDIEALYTYSFSMDPTDKEGAYRIKVRAKDKEKTIERNSEYKFPEETASPAGRFLAVQESATNIFDLFKSLFSSIINLFK
jgi:hypothetical protein